jgi:hypothetical protein
VGGEKGRGRGEREKGRKGEGEINEIMKREI